MKEVERIGESNASGLLTSLDSLFTTQDSRDEAKRDSVQDIPISQISDFPEHPFKGKSRTKAMLEMAEACGSAASWCRGLCGSWRTAAIR